MTTSDGHGFSNIGFTLDGTRMTLVQAYVADADELVVGWLAEDGECECLLVNVYVYPSESFCCVG